MVPFLTFLKQLARDIGPLRVMHTIFLLILIVSAPFAGGEGARSGFAMWPTLIAPALVPIFYFVLPLDMTMSAVTRSGVVGEEHARLTRVIRIDAILFVALLAAWLPFFLALVSYS